ncbi:MAG: rhodanese-like domain-containing protein [Chitinivibrionia bacterium]|nr:rhodanese-like domain-containing protein [Chitinivibrionia bacterium]
MKANNYSLLNNRVITIAIILLGLVVLFGHGTSRASGQNETVVERRISASEAKRIMTDSANVIILDVRTEQEFRQSRIKNSVNFPVNEIKENASIVIPDKNALILVYCRSGGRSRTAANTLISIGYTNVYDFGGIQSWGYGTVRE